jgi:hypothetical protein
MFLRTEGARGGKEFNRIYAQPGKPWVSIFRFCGPDKALFDGKRHGNRTVN